MWSAVVFSDVPVAAKLEGTSFANGMKGRGSTMGLSNHGTALVLDVDTP